ncbi:amidase family protein [Nocardia takedensis]|uniref:amidase family protein n=1 Tax=Nocardia takedensis TaxID=259390 RepID=UPI00247B0898|nr:amidase family protein [Nocardia takedensis]
MVVDRVAPGRRAPALPRTAEDILSAVHEGALIPSELVAAALARIAVADRELNAFTVVRAEQAVAEARALECREDLDMLALAGVPVAVEHAVASPVLGRLREAGAVLAGTTSGAGAGPRADVAESRTRNPWNPDLAGGGAAAAVAAGLVPLAVGADAFGAVRLGAARCGVFGFSPGRRGPSARPGPAEHSVVATSVADAALALSVLAARPDPVDGDPPRRLRIGVAVDPPHRLFRVDGEWAAAAWRAAAATEAEGHLVEPVTLPYGAGVYEALLRRVTGLSDGDLSEELSPGLLSPRSARLRHLVRPAQLDRIEARLLELFDSYDVVITPTLAAPPPRARNRAARGRLPDILSAARSAAFTAMWDLLGWPAASIPMGSHSRSATPLAAQFVGQPGSESTLLRLAAQVERREPWRRVAG